MTAFALIAASCLVLASACNGTPRTGHGTKTTEQGTDPMASIEMRTIPSLGRGELLGMRVNANGAVSGNPVAYERLGGQR